MPELPEVETVKRGIAPALEGNVISFAEKFRPNLRIAMPEDFSERLTGKRVAKLHRRSKYILIEMEDGLVIILHLGMSGKVTLYNRATDTIPERGKHDHVILETDKGIRLVYTDPRRFGIITFTHVDEADNHKLLAGIGPEPLGNDFNSDTLKRAFENKKSPIKTALLDQRIVAGLGNIYVCEVLWRVGIHPATAAHKITPDQIEIIVPTIRTVLLEAIEAGGSTLKDYARADGELGYFQHSFRAYGREKEPCLNEACDGTIERITQSGRSTFFCSACQK